MKNKREVFIKEKFPASAKDFLCFCFRLYFVLSRTIRVRNVVPLLEFCLTIKAFLKKEYKKCFTWNKKILWSKMMWIILMKNRISSVRLSTRSLNSTEKCAYSKCEFSIENFIKILSNFNQSYRYMLNCYIRPSL